MVKQNPAPYPRTAALGLLLTLLTAAPIAAEDASGLTIVDAFAAACAEAEADPEAAFAAVQAESDYAANESGDKTLMTFYRSIDLGLSANGTFSFTRNTYAGGTETVCSVYFSTTAGDPTDQLYRTLPLAAHEKAEGILGGPTRIYGGSPIVFGEGYQSRAWTVGEVFPYPASMTYQWVEGGSSTYLLIIRQIPKAE
jgi:hypothetical protein